ncbi:MAG: cytochrome c3 family protein [Candidatus Aminicenantales bacterium]
MCHFKKSEHYPRISDCSHCHHKEDLISEKTSRYNHTLVFENGFDCNKCHSHILVGDGEVPRENCYKCHWETERLNKYDDTDLMHNTHIYLHKIECNQCHLDIQHKVVKELDAIADCQTCHPDYHKAQKVLFMGEGGKGIPHPEPNIMLEKGLSCKGCHIFHEEKGGRVIKSETLISKAQACESCHGKGFARIMKDWEISTEKKLNKIRNIYKRAAQEIKATRNAKRKKAQRWLEEAAFNIDIVERGKGVHNVAYAQELLSASYNRITEALQLIGSSYKPESFLGVSKEIPTQCSNCHAGIEEINKEIFGLEFPHQKHLIEQKIQCDTCHSNARKHGEFIASKHSCAVCHHKDTEKDCTVCHKLQKTFYQGGSLDGQGIPADIMAEADVQCTDCHLGPQNQIIHPDKNKCLDCHEEDYSEIFDEWQNTTQEMIQFLQASLKEKKKLPLSQQEKARVSEMESLLNAIALDGSHGVHNYLFVEEMLSGLKEKSIADRKHKPGR